VKGVSSKLGKVTMAMEWVCVCGGVVGGRVGFYRKESV